MKFKYMILLLSAFIIIFLPNVYAADMLKLYKINFDPAVTDTIEGKLLAYKCLDSSCSQVEDVKADIYKKEAWDCLSSSSGIQEFETCIAPYKIQEGEVVSLKENMYVMLRFKDISNNAKYAFYVFAKDYIGYVNLYTVNSVCNNPFCVDNVIAQSKPRKIEYVSFQLENLKLENYHNRNDPLFIDIPVKISAQVCNALRFNGIVGYIPPEDGEIIDYRLDGDVIITVNDANNNVLFTKKEHVSILPQTCSSHISFTWTPTQVGEIMVRWVAEVEDNQVINGGVSKAYANTVVYDPYAAACQSILTSVSITDSHGEARIGSSDNPRLHFEYKSQAYMAPGNVYPVDSILIVRIYDKHTATYVYEKTINLPSQNNLLLKSYVFTIPKTFDQGNYRVELELKGNEVQCSSYNVPTNIPVTYNLDFDVYKDSFLVEFIVQDNRDRSPISNALIKVINKQQMSQNYVEYTDETGKATFNLPGETGYAYKVTKEGYEDAYGIIYWLTNDLKIFVTLLPTITYDEENHAPHITTFTAVPNEGIEPLNVIFTYEVVDQDNDDLTCYFDFDNDGNADEIVEHCSSGSISHVYNIAGTYQPRLQVKDEKYGEDESVLTVVVHEEKNTKPQIFTFDALPTNGTAPLSVTFSYAVGDADGDDLTCYFDFDNNGLVDKILYRCTAGSVTYTYAAEGTYIAKLTLRDEDNAQAEATVTIVVTVPSNNNPVINVFSASPTSGYAPLDVTFSYDVSDADNDALTCYFDANNDGNYEKIIPNCNAGTITHTYTTAATYTAKLRVVDEHSAQAEATVTIVVTVPSNNNPVINVFSASPTSGYAPLDVTFSYDVSDADNDALTCYFDANNDGNYEKIIPNCNAGTITHTYTTAATYTAKLRVVDEHSAQAEATVTIVVTSYTGSGGGTTSPSADSSSGGYYTPSTSPTYPLTPNYGDIVIEDVDVPSVLYYGLNNSVNITLRNKEDVSFSNIEVMIVFGNYVTSKTLSFEENEERELNFELPTYEPYVYPNTYYYLYVKIYDSNGNLVNQYYKNIYVKKVVAEFSNVVISKEYNADEPIVYSFCISNPVTSIVNVYVDDMLMVKHYIPDYENTRIYCVQNYEMGNVFNNGTHTFKLENGPYTYKDNFNVTFYIRIGEIALPHELYANVENIIPIVVETQIPSYVSVYIIEDDSKVRGSLSLYIADREKVYLPYVPTSSGNHNLKIFAVLEDNGKKAVRKLNDVHVSSSGISSIFSSIF